MSRAVTKSALVPKLRFPEFRGAEGWKPETIGSYLVDCSERVPSDTELPIYSSTRDGLKRQDVYFDGKVLQNNNDYGAVPPDCFVYRHMSDDGLFKFNINETGGDIAVSKEYPVFRTSGLNSRFLLAKLNDDFDFRQFALSQKAGGTRTRLYFSKLCEWQTLLPSIAEQQKIADCLSSLDELIATQARKVDALKTHKKVLMQQLFPREGETQPRLRFPEFRDAGEWEEKRLEQLGRVIRGASPRPKSDPRYFGGPIPRLMVQDVTRDGKWVTPQIDSLTDEGAELSRPCPAGTLTIVCSGNVGIVSFLAVDACIHDGFLALIDIDESISTKDFLFHCLSTLREEFEKSATHGGVFTNLTTTVISQFKICHPPFAEQQRIATCLTSLDDLITAQIQALETLKTHKKGLMQQLFPAAEVSA